MPDVVIDESFIGQTLGGSMDGRLAARRLGEYLQQLRNERNLTLHDVTTALGWKPGVLYRIESEKKTLTEPEQLLQLAEFYGVTDTELLRRAGFQLKGVSGAIMSESEQREAAMR